MLMTISLSVASSNEHVTFFGVMGLVAAVVFANLGAGYGTAKSGVGICSMGVLRPTLIFKSVIPVIMAGVLGMYGLIIAFMINSAMNDPQTVMDFKMSYKMLASGLCCGLSALSAGLTIGVVGDAGVRAFGQQEKIFSGLLLILIFAEAIALYGFIIGLIMILGGSQKPEGK